METYLTGWATKRQIDFSSAIGGAMFSPYWSEAFSNAKNNNQLLCILRIPETLQNRRNTWFGHLSAVAVLKGYWGRGGDPPHHISSAVSNLKLGNSLVRTWTWAWFTFPLKQQIKGDRSKLNRVRINAYSPRTVVVTDSFCATYVAACVFKFHLSFPSNKFTKSVYSSTIQSITFSRHLWSLCCGVASPNLVMGHVGTICALPEEMQMFNITVYLYMCADI